MKKEDIKIYYNNVWLFITWFFIAFTFLMGAIIITSFINSSYDLFILLVSLILFVLLLIIILKIIYSVKIYQDSEKIIIYGKRFEDVGLRKAFKEGLEIRYDNIRTMDLVPIKFYNMIISYQIYIKTYTPNQTYYIYSISNLDKLFSSIRAYRFKPRKKDK